MWQRVWVRTLALRPREAILLDAKIAEQIGELDSLGGTEMSVGELLAFAEGGFDDVEGEAVHGRSLKPVC